MASVEQRLVDLENENKARKGSYPIAGSLAKFVSQVSQTFEYVMPVGESARELRIKFIAKNTKDGKSLVDVSPQVSINSNFSTPYPHIAYINEPQADDGSIVLRFYLWGPVDQATRFYFRAFANGVSTGTFSLL